MEWVHALRTDYAALTEKKLSAIWMAFIFQLKKRSTVVKEQFCTPAFDTLE